MLDPGRGNGEPAARAVRRLAAGFAALLALTWALIVLGALVRAHAAGLACPDWPLCFGELVPRFDLKVAFEYAHRATAGTVSLAFAGLAALALRAAATRRATARLLALAAALLALQILLGALTVWHLLAFWSVTAHLLTGTSFALTLLAIACALRDLAAPPIRRARVSGASRATLVLAAVLLAAQIALGGLVSSRYAGLACPEWPTCNGGLWFPAWQAGVGLHLLHRYNGYALLAALGAAACASRSRRAPAPRDARGARARRRPGRRGDRERRARAPRRDHGPALGARDRARADARVRAARGCAQRAGASSPA